MKAKYLYIIEKGKRNYSAYVPDLPGCISTGKTIKKTEKMIMEAIDFHVEGMILNGEKLPKPSIEGTGFFKINFNKKHFKNLNGDPSSR